VIPAQPALPAPKVWRVLLARLVKQAMTARWARLARPARRANAVQWAPLARLARKD
jgi:hypothetical protein